MHILLVEPICDHKEFVQDQHQHRHKADYRFGIYYFNPIIKNSYIEQIVKIIFPSIFLRKIIHHNEIEYNSIFNWVWIEIEGQRSRS